MTKKMIPESECLCKTIDELKKKLEEKGLNLNEMVWHPPAGKGL